MRECVNSKKVKQVFWLIPFEQQKAVDTVMGDIPKNLIARD
jgi:hypothetical protein